MEGIWQAWNCLKLLFPQTSSVRIPHAGNKRTCGRELNNQCSRPPPPGRGLGLWSETTGSLVCLCGPLVYGCVVHLNSVFHPNAKEETRLSFDGKSVHHKKIVRKIRSRIAVLSNGSICMKCDRNTRHRTNEFVSQENRSAGSGSSGNDSNEAIPNMNIPNVIWYGESIAQDLENGVMHMFLISSNIPTVQSTILCP